MVIRRIPDCNAEFGLDIAEILDKPSPRAPSEPGIKLERSVTREKIFQVLVQVAKALLQSDDLVALLNTVMDMIFEYLHVELGLISRLDDNGDPVSKLTTFIEVAAHQDIPTLRAFLQM